MPRIDLDVPFLQKDEAKQLGARWDGAKKVWYVPENADAALFRKWMYSPGDGTLRPNLRADHYFIAETTRECWCCKQLTRLYAFILPAGYEALQEDDPQKDDWQLSSAPTLLSYVSLLPKNARRQVASLTRRYHVNFSKTISGSYWMNHCEHCNVKQGDFYTLEDHGSPFHSLSAAPRTHLVLHEIREPFEGRASYGDYPPEMGLLNKGASLNESAPADVPEDIPKSSPRPARRKIQPAEKPRDLTGMARLIHRLLQRLKKFISKLLRLFGI